MVTLLAFLVDILLFVPHMQWGGWIVLVSTILIVASGVVTCAMRRTLVSRKARKKRIAQNAEMNGENFYNRQNAPGGARAETPPPLASQPAPPMVNGAPGADKLPTFATYEKDLHDFEEDRIPLNTRTPSNPTVPNNGMHSRPSEEGFEMQGPTGRGGLPRGGPRGMRGGRGGYSGPRDEYGNPLPPSNAFGPSPGGTRRDQSEPRMRGQYSDENMNGFRGRGRGGFPPRGYGRGAPYGPARGGSGNGRGMPGGMAAGAEAGMMAVDMRSRHGPPPDYSNGYPPVGDDRPGQYEQGPALYGRSPSAPAYGRRSPGPPSAPGYGRAPSPDLISQQRGYGRRPSPGPPSHPGGYGRQPSPGGRSAPGGYGRQSPGPPRTSGDYARQRSNSNPRTYDYHVRQPSPRGYQGQGMRAESPPPPMPQISASEPVIGQAIEMDATTGSPSHTPAPIRPMQLRDSDSDVQGLVGLQQQREHRESPLSLTSVYSSQEYACALLVCVEKYELTKFVDRIFPHAPLGLIRRPQQITTLLICPTTTSFLQSAIRQSPNYQLRRLEAHQYHSSLLPLRIATTQLTLQATPATTLQITIMKTLIPASPNPTNLTTLRTTLALDFQRG